MCSNRAGDMLWMQDVLASEFDMLLNEAKRASDWAQKEAQRQASNLRKTEDLIASAKKMVLFVCNLLNLLLQVEIYPFCSSNGVSAACRT